MSNVIPQQPDTTFIREYKVTKGGAIVTYVVALLLILLFAGILFMPFIPPMQEGMPLDIYWFLAPLSIGMILYLVNGVMDTIKGKFIIDHDKVFAIKAFSNRQLYFDEIKGYRIDDYYIYIEPNTEGKKKIKISNQLSKTHEIIAWLSSYYPDLDVLQVEQEEQVILGNEELGWTIEQREDKYRKARQTAKTLNWSGGIVAAWTLFWPEPYEYAVIASMMVPILAIMALKLSNGLLRLDERKDSAYPSILTAIFAPGAAVSLRALLDFQIFDYNNAWILCGITATTIVTVLLFGSKEFKFKKVQDYIMLSGMLMAVLFYSYGSVVTLNCTFDNSEPTVYHATILSKRAISGKTKSYYLELTPWGPQKEAEEVSVSEELYERLGSNDEVTVYFMKGYLDVPWFVVTE